MINHVYDPLVDAARTNSPHGQNFLEQLGEKLLNANRSQQQILPTILSGLSIIAVVVTAIVRN